MKSSFELVYKYQTNSKAIVFYHLKDAYNGRGFIANFQIIVLTESWYASRKVRENCYSEGLPWTIHTFTYSCSCLHLLFQPFFVCRFGSPLFDCFFCVPIQSLEAILLVSWVSFKISVIIQLRVELIASIRMLALT